MSFKYKLEGIQSRIPLIKPDKTFYEGIKGLSLTNNPVVDLQESNLAPPRCLKLSSEYLKGWTYHHAPLIEAAYKGRSSKIPFRSIFPGPYIPTLETEMTNIGDTAYSVYKNILTSIKQRIPRLNKLRKNSIQYFYQSDYKPITRKITEPEEAWGFFKIKCPTIGGVNFPLPPTYEYEPDDYRYLRKALDNINKKSRDFCNKYLGGQKSRTKDDIVEIISFIDSVQNLFRRKVPGILARAFEEVMCQFDKFNQPPKHPAEFLFEIKHALSYLITIKNFPLICSGPYSSFWVDVLQLPLENLIETELGDIQRVLREIRSFFTLGWAPIIVHLDKKLGFNTDGTHRHYALLTIELLKRLKLAHNNQSIRKIDINSRFSYQAIMDFSAEYKKYGLSLRETLRVINYIINSDAPWPYIDVLEDELRKIFHVNFKYVPVVFLPEWRARSVVKNLCDKGIALVGVPPKNIYIVGRSNGKKGIFIRGGYHGTDRQPMAWMNYFDLQKL